MSKENYILRDPLYSENAKQLEEQVKDVSKRGNQKGLCIVMINMEIKEGRFNLETGLIGELTLQRGRKWVKKN